MKAKLPGLHLLVLSLVLALAGCTSVPVDTTPKQELIANAVEDVISIGLVPVLTKNASYLAEARSVAALLGSFAGTELTSADVDSFVSRLKVAPDDAKAIAGVINAAWSTYQKRYAEQVGKTLRPDVKLFLGAVSRGILNAVAAVPKG